MKIRVTSIPWTDEERAQWPEDGTPCPRCGEPMNMGELFGKLVKDIVDGERLTVHKRCSDGSYARRTS